MKLPASKLVLAGSLAAVPFFAVGSATAAFTSWQNVFSADFEGDDVGSAPTGFNFGAPGDEILNSAPGDTLVEVVDAASSPLGTAGNALRISDSATDGGSAGVRQDLGQNYGVLRLDFEFRRFGLQQSSGFEPFNVGFANAGESVTSTNRRAVELRLKMAGQGVELQHQTSPGVGASQTNDVLGFFDGGSNNSVSNDLTTLVQIVANSDTTEDFIYEALDGSGSVMLGAKQIHVYTNGTLNAGPYYLRSTASGTNYYDDNEEFGAFGFIAGSSQDDFNFVFDNINAYVVPEPSTFALLGLGGLAMTRRRRA